jgi:hypothetical protein
MTTENIDDAANLSDSATLSDTEALARLTVQNTEDIAALAYGLVDIAAVMLDVAAAVVGPQSVRDALGGAEVPEPKQAA